jgi:hypothetical protein
MQASRRLKVMVDRERSQEPLRVDPVLTRWARVQRKLRQLELLERIARSLERRRGAA